MGIKVNKTKIRPYWLVAAIFIAIKLLVHLLTNTRYELMGDEMLFFNMGEHLSAGYATVPPVTGFLAFLMHHIFGFSVFGIRLFPALMGVASVYMIALLVKEFGGGVTALIIAASSYLFATGILLATTLFTPNAFDELTWLLAILLIIRMVKNGDHRKWILYLLYLQLVFSTSTLCFSSLPVFCLL